MMYLQLCSDINKTFLFAGLRPTQNITELEVHSVSSKAETTRKSPKSFWRPEKKWAIRCILDHSNEHFGSTKKSQS